MAVGVTQKWTGQISWAQNMLSLGLSPIVSIAWCVALNVISAWPRSVQRLIMCEHVWCPGMVARESMGHCRVSAFREGLVLTSIEPGCYNRVAENITEPAISSAWHFVVNLIYLHISCATVQTNQWAESRNHFLRPSSNWYQRGQNWK